MDNKITVVYFSPTGNTKKSVHSIAEAICFSYNELDITTKAEHRSFSEDQFVIIGTPVYGGRIPNVARDRLSLLRGNKTKCIVVVTYGNRDYDDALLELSNLMTENGFVVEGAAALIGRHTFGEIQVNRPDENDIKLNKTFAVQVAAKQETGKLSVPGKEPYKDGGGGGRFRPLTSSECIKCNLCVTHCPVQAIAADCKSISNECLSCFRCIRNCPVGAKNMNTDEYNNFAGDFTKKLEKRKENQYFL